MATGALFFWGKMKLGDWDYLVAFGLIATAAGVWMTFGMGPTLMLVGILVTLVGIGGAARR